ncbi:MAG: hypothetical protein AB7G37_06945 [Solirubrobacteraceae bacterium]
MSSFDTSSSGGGSRIGSGLTAIGVVVALVAIFLVVKFIAGIISTLITAAIVLGVAWVAWKIFGPEPKAKTP